MGADKVWIIPLLPLISAAVLAFSSKKARRLAGAISIAAMVGGFLLSLAAFMRTFGHHEAFREVYNFTWMQVGHHPIKLGFSLDPLTAVMLLMVTFVGSLIFIYSTGYMAHDENYVKFFCFMSLFAAGMLGLIVANSLILFFMCWEIVGLASYLLIGFWYFKPSAAAAAQKAFITTRIGDIGFFLGILWLYAESGTLVLYDGGSGCLEQGALNGLASAYIGGLGVVNAISLLIFCGAVGKSGQVPLHVWLPDAMEGPTPVSALIHAATMVAAGVFLVARVYPLMDVDPANIAGISPALTVITWVGAITAVFAALIAVAQSDIKRILAYSTISQLGYMMMGLGVGGVSVGMFHLITHAFFKALLFMGAGSVIHGCDGEQDIRRMGGLRKFMPITFATYAIGTMALTGIPLVFSGFWSKDEILHAALGWKLSKGPFFLGLFGAFLTAFYMTRQVIYVFFGDKVRGDGKQEAHAHESPTAMTAPLVVLAACAILLGIIGTPAWPWFEGYLNGHYPDLAASKIIAPEFLRLVLLSTLVVAFGIFGAWKLYGGRQLQSTEGADPLCVAQPGLFAVLRDKFYVDEIYERSVILFNRLIAQSCALVDRWAFPGLIKAGSLLVLGFSWMSRLFDLFVIDRGFDKGCGDLRIGSNAGKKVQSGNAQAYLRAIGVALAVIVLLLVWGIK
jgi:NADH-quinone oxidoreductase subunit L